MAEDDSGLPGLPPMQGGMNPIAALLLGLGQGLASPAQGGYGKFKPQLGQGIAEGLGAVGQAYQERTALGEKRFNMQSDLEKLKQGRQDIEVRRQNLIDSLAERKSATEESIAARKEVAQQSNELKGAIAASNADYHSGMLALLGQKADASDKPKPRPPLELVGTKEQQDAIASTNKILAQGVPDSYYYGKILPEYMGLLKQGAKPATGSKLGQKLEETVGKLTPGKQGAAGKRVDVTSPEGAQLVQDTWSAHGEELKAASNNFHNEEGFARKAVELGIPKDVAKAIWGAAPKTHSGNPSVVPPEYVLQGPQSPSLQPQMNPAPTTPGMPVAGPIPPPYQMVGPEQPPAPIPTPGPMPNMRPGGY